MKTIVTIVQIKKTLTEPVVKGFSYYFQLYPCSQTHMCFLNEEHNNLFDIHVDAELCEEKIILKPDNNTNNLINCSIAVAKYASIHAN